MKLEKLLLQKSTLTRIVRAQSPLLFAIDGRRRGLNVANPPKKPGQSSQHATFGLSRSPKPVNQYLFGHPQLCRCLPIRLGGFLRVPLQSLEDIFRAH
jgi:hypothetical protein